MTDSRLPPHEADELRELRARVRALEMQQRAKTTSIRSGAVELLNEDGNQVGRLGALETSVPPDAGLIVNVENPSGPLDAHLLVSGRSGVELPWLAHPWSALGPNPFSTTSTSFVSTWQCAPRMVTGPEVDFAVIVSADASTPGEVRLLEADYQGNPAVQLGVTKSIAAGSAAFRFFAADIFGDVGDGRTTFTLQARVVSGPGSVHVYHPFEMAMGKWFPTVTANGWQ